MGRVHLFELEDQSWFPETIRAAMTGYLRLVAELSRHGTAIAPILKSAVDRSGADRIVDLGSGGGGPTLACFRALHEGSPELQLTLTDLHPNVGALERAAEEVPGAIRVVTRSVDATAVPAELGGVRTLMNVFHHLRAEAARSVLQSAVDARQPIVVVELLRRHPLVILACLFTWLPVLLSVPFLRPFRWSWLLWTYVLPVIPLASVWDAFVSSLRIYSEPELRRLIDDVDGSDSYDWDIGALDLPPSPVGGTYLIGTPRA